MFICSVQILNCTEEWGNQWCLSVPTWLYIKTDFLEIERGKGAKNILFLAKAATAVSRYHGIGHRSWSATLEQSSTNRCWAASIVKCTFFSVSRILFNSNEQIGIFCYFVIMLRTYQRLENINETRPLTLLNNYNCIIARSVCSGSRFLPCFYFTFHHNLYSTSIEQNELAIDIIIPIADRSVYRYDGTNIHSTLIWISWQWSHSPIDH